MYISSDSRYINMKLISRYIILPLLILCCVSVKAETISQKEAKHIASLFFNAAYGQVMADPVYVYNGKRLTTDRLFSPFYVFNHPAGGFVVISAENKAFPILGFSMAEHFDADRIGEKTRALLKLYAQHIENIRYDSETPFEAIYAWQNIPEHIAGILSADSRITDQLITDEDAINELWFTAESADAEASASSFYTPDQWEDQINAELDSKRNVALGIIEQQDIVPIIIKGRQGAYYRLSLDAPNRQLWRLLPSEILSVGEIASFGNPPAMPMAEEQDKPFEFYERIMAENYKAYQADRAAIEDALVITEPVVKGHGLGIYSVTLPELAVNMRVFNSTGTQMSSEKFRDTNTAHVDLTKLPSGLYFAVIFGESGRPYGIKLFR